MWLPMMPGRHYQLVEVQAPTGFVLPWGQWRITVIGATDNTNIAGTGLAHRVINTGSPGGTHNIIFLPNYVNLGGCTPNCLTGCTDNHDYYIGTFFVLNMANFDLPFTGGMGITAMTTLGFTVISLAIVLLLLRKKIFPKYRYCHIPKL